MTRRDPCLLQLKHGALLVLTLIFAVTAGRLIRFDKRMMEKNEPWIFHNNEEQHISTLPQITTTINQHLAVTSLSQNEPYVCLVKPWTFKPDSFHTIT